MTTTATTEVAEATAGCSQADGGGHRRLIERLFDHVDIASLAYFRIVVGAIVVWEVVRYFVHGWITRYYVVPTFHFTYYGFSWVRPWPAWGMHLHFALLGVCAAGVMLGWCYRAAAVGLWAAFSYVFLLDQARYLNHFYLLALITFLLMWLPAHRAWSIDAYRDRRLKSDTAPAWALWIVRFQIAVPYFYAGIAKLNPDWLSGEPLGAWLRAQRGTPVIGPILANSQTPLLLAFGGIIFDLSIVPLLLWRRTRALGFIAAVLFHGTNSLMFQIGIFPALMLGATAMFFEPSWPRRLAQRLGSAWIAAPREWVESSFPANRRLPERGRMITVAIIAYVVVQLVVPLRHWAYPGDVNWSDEGHRFSWRMKLRDKDAVATFIEIDRDTGEHRVIDPGQYLTAWQIDAMGSRPDMILQFAHFVRARQTRPARVTAVVWASLNGHPYRQLIDPTVDLGSEPRTLRPVRWILQ